MGFGFFGYFRGVFGVLGVFGGLGCFGMFESFCVIKVFENILWHFISWGKGLWRFGILCSGW